MRGFPSKESPIPFAAISGSMLIFRGVNILVFIGFHVYHVQDFFLWRVVHCTMQHEGCIFDPQSMTWGASHPSIFFHIPENTVSKRK